MALNGIKVAQSGQHPRECSITAITGVRFLDPAAACGVSERHPWLKSRRRLIAAFLATLSRSLNTAVLSRIAFFPQDQILKKFAASERTDTGG
jgi:hypothetical protein